MAAEVPASDIQNMSSKDHISEDTMKYLRDKRVPELMEYLLRSIIQEKPSEPAAFIHDVTSQSLPPHIMIAGPPASGKGTQAHQICAYYKQKTGRKPVHISSGDLLREEIAKGTNLGLIAEGYTKVGRFVPDSLIIGIIRKRLQEEDAIMNGWLLDGFPRTREQASALDLAGFAPELFLVLDIADEMLVDRVEGRRVDPADGTIYHLKYNPPPEEDVALMDRLEHREDDTRDVLMQRLTEYHKYVDGLMEFYAPVTQRVDANRGQLDITDDITERLEGVRLR